MNDPTFRPISINKRSSAPFWLIGLIVVLILLFVGGSILLYYTLIVQPEQHADPHRQATATAESLTSLLQIPVNELYHHVTDRPPSFTDSLDGHNTAAWDLTTQNGKGCVFKNKALHILVSSQTVFVACYLHNMFPSNFAFQAKINLTQAVTTEQTNSGGIIFRGDLTKQTAYTYQVITHTNGLLTDTHTDLVFNGANARPNILFTQTDAALTDLREPKELTVIALQNKIYTYINKKLIGSKTDTSASKGAVGLFAVNGGPDPLIDVVFQNARLWVF